MRHTLGSGSGMRPLIFTSEGPKEMSQQIGKVLSDCKTAEHDQSLGFNTYPPALQLQISLLRDHGFRVMNEQIPLFCVLLQSLIYAFEGPLSYY